MRSLETEVRKVHKKFLTVTNNKTQRNAGLAYSRLLSSYASIGAMLKVKLGRPAIPHILSCVALLARRINLSVVKVVITYLATLHRLQKKGGLRFLVIYLKACSSLLQQFIGGQRLHDLGPFGARVGRTHSGCPSIIPSLHRQRIRSGCVWTIRFWMTLFGLYRILEFPGKVKLDTITAESKMDPSLVPKFSHFVTHHLIKVLKLKFPVEGSITDALWSEDGEGPLEFMKGLRARPFLISKSGPSIRDAVVSQGGKASPSSITVQSTSPVSVLASAWMWRHSPLYSVLTNWCKMTGNTAILNRIESWTKDLHCDVKITTNWSGALGFKNEPAGKVRVFAMVDPWTQWLLDRLHRAIFKLLAVIPQDGTFDQLKPIHLMKRWQEVNRDSRGRLQPVYSFDLSAATDRIPVILQKVLLSPFLTAWGAELWATLLVGRPYSCPKKRLYMRVGKNKIYQLLCKDGFVQYATGQPMGALSSWAMLAFVHHAFVQWAALSCGKITIGKGWYEGYAILGDDVVIVGKDVAARYLALMAQMDVKIGDHKSLISKSGMALEFAKRTFLGKEDVSMVPFAEFVMGRQSLAGLLELVRKYKLTFGQTLSVLGYGYKAKADASKRVMMLPKRLRNYILALSGPGGPFFSSLKNWMGMKSLTSVYKTVDDRASTFVTRLLEQEVKLMLDILETYQGLVDLARKLGTVYRDREYYGTLKREPSKPKARLRVTNWNPESSTRVLSVDEQIARLHQSVSFQEAWDASRNAYDPTRVEAIRSMIMQETARIIAAGPITVTVDGDPQMHESIDVGPLPLVSEVPKADGLSEVRLAISHPLVEAPQFVLDELNEFLYRNAFLDVAIAHRDLRTKLEELSISSLDWAGIEALWTELRAIETQFGEVPFPKNILSRPSEGSPPKTVGKVLKRWYRHSGTFRATVNPVGSETKE